MIRILKPLITAAAISTFKMWVLIERVLGDDQAIHFAVALQRALGECLLLRAKVFVC